MTKEDLIDNVKKGIPVRWVPRSISGVRPDAHELSIGIDQLDLFIGPRKAKSHEEDLAIIVCLKDGPCRCIPRPNPLGGKVHFIEMK